MSGVGAAAVKRDRKTGQVRDLEKEKEAQKEKAAKDSVLKEKYHKWGKGYVSHCFLINKKCVIFLNNPKQSSS